MGSTPKAVSKDGMVQALGSDERNDDGLVIEKREPQRQGVINRDIELPLEMPLRAAGGTNM
jgi:hypothetical protein